jgi:methanogenic corrinoid protein MtbC1
MKMTLSKKFRRVLLTTTALMEAARGGYTEIIEILKKAGAKE